MYSLFQGGNGHHDVKSRQLSLIFFTEAKLVYGVAQRENLNCIS